MDKPVQGDEAEYVPVAQGSSPQRQNDLRSVGQMLAGRCGRWRQGNPGIAEYAAMPAKPVPGLPNKQVVDGPDGRDVGAEQLVAAQPAADEFVVEPGPYALGPHRSWRWLAMP